MDGYPGGDVNGGPMSQARFGGVAVPAQQVAKMDDYGAGALMPPYAMDMPSAPRRRRSTYQIGAGAGAVAAGAGMVNAARTYTPAAAAERAATARAAAEAPMREASAAAARARAAAQRDAAGSTSQTRRQVRRANENYRRTLPGASSANNRAMAAEAYAGRTLGRRLKLAGGGVGLLAGGAYLLRGGMRRRAEGD